MKYHDIERTRLSEGLRVPQIVSTYIDLASLHGREKAEGFLEAVTGERGDTPLHYWLHSEIVHELQHQARVLYQRSKTLTIV